MALLQGFQERNGMKTKRTRYQEGSIRKVARANGFAWKVRFSAGTVDGKSFFVACGWHSAEDAQRIAGGQKSSIDQLAMAGASRINKYPRQNAYNSGSICR
jgi:hypothetical protein